MSPASDDYSGGMNSANSQLLYISTIRENFKDKLSQIVKLELSYIVLRPANGIESAIENHFFNKYSFIDDEIRGTISQFCAERKAFLDLNVQGPDAGLGFTKYYKLIRHLNRVDALPGNLSFIYNSNLKSSSKCESTRVKFNSLVEEQIVLFNYSVYLFNSAMALDWRLKSDCLKATDQLCRCATIFKLLPEYFASSTPNSAKVLPDMAHEFLSILYNLSMMYAHILQCFPLNEMNQTDLVPLLLILNSFTTNVTQYVHSKEWKHNQIQSFVVDLDNFVNFSLKLIDVYNYLQCKEQKISELIALLQNASKYINPENECQLGELITTMLNYQMVRNNSIYLEKIPENFSLEQPQWEYLVHEIAFEESELDGDIDSQFFIFLNDEEIRIYLDQVNQHKEKVNELLAVLDERIENLEKEFEERKLNRMQCKVHKTVTEGQLMAIFQKVITSPEFPVDFKKQAIQWNKIDIKLTNSLMKQVNFARGACGRKVDSLEKFAEDAYIKINKAKDLDQKFYEQERMIYRQIDRISDIKSFEKFKNQFIAEKYAKNALQEILVLIKQHHIDLQVMKQSWEQNDIHKQLYYAIKQSDAADGCLDSLNKFYEEYKAKLECLTTKGEELLNDLNKSLVQSSKTENEDGFISVSYYPHASKWYTRLKKYLELRGPDSQYVQSKSWHDTFQKKIKVESERLAMMYLYRTQETLNEAMRKLSH